MQRSIYLMLIGVLVSTCFSDPLTKGKCTDEDYLVPLPKCPVNENASGNFSHPTDCTKYFMCSNGVPICYECNKAFRWDQKLQSCSDSFVDCHVGSQDAPSPANVICPIGYPGLVPHHNCSMYYQCAHGVPIEMMCKEGLYFDRVFNFCNWPECVEECLGATRPPIRTVRSTGFGGSKGRECGLGNRGKSA